MPADGQERPRAAVALAQLSQLPLPLVAGHCARQRRAVADLATAVPSARPVVPLAAAGGSGAGGAGSRRPTTVSSRVLPATAPLPLSPWGVHAGGLWRWQSAWLRRRWRRRELL